MLARSPVAAGADRDLRRRRARAGCAGAGRDRRPRDHRPGQPRRRLGPDGARHAGGAAGGRARLGRPGRRTSRGAGGTIGLAQFVTTKKRKGDAVLVGGLVMVGRHPHQQGAGHPGPTSRRWRGSTGEYELIVVPADSPIQTLGDLVAKLKADPGSVSWGGGSVGGTDHILAGLVAKAAGRRPDQGQLHRPLRRRRGASARSSAATSPRASAATRSSRRRSRPASCAAIAISSDERLPGVDIPTLKEQGVDVALVNWRGLFAAAGHPRRGPGGAVRRASPKMVAEPGLEGRRSRSAAGSTSTSRPTSSRPSWPRTKPRSTTTLKDIGLVQ